MKLKVNSNVVMQRQVKPARKKYSATSSSFSPEWLLRMARKENVHAVMNSKVATAVHSSIKVPAFNCHTLRDVNIKKQMPNKLAELERMCSDMGCFFMMV